MPAATILAEENHPELPGAASGVETPIVSRVETPMPVTHGDEERVKMTCHVCFSGWNAAYYLLFDVLAYMCVFCLCHMCV